MLVHGIAQEQYGADVLERLWIPALASGIRAAGEDQSSGCADALLESVAHTGRIDVRMAFYGDLFLRRYEQGPNDSLADLDADQQAFAETLAFEWLVRACSRTGHPDQARARELRRSLSANADDQGPTHRAAGAAIRAISRFPWMAAPGMAFAELLSDAAFAR